MKKGEYLICKKTIYNNDIYDVELFGLTLFKKTGYILSIFLSIFLIVLAKLKNLFKKQIYKKK